MKILLVTNMFPNVDNPYYGIFIKEQMDSICNYFPEITYDVYFIEGYKSKFAYLKSVYEIHNILNRKQYDLIHIHYGFSGLFLLKGMHKKIPVVVTLHGGDIQMAQKKWIQVYFTKQVLKKVDYAIYLNDYMGEVINQYAKKKSKIPCAVDLNLFRPIDKKEVTDNIYKIIFPSCRQRTVKNYSLFREVISILRNKYLLLIEEIELNHFSRIEVAHLFQTADLMLLTSYSEGSPQVIKEAMACNLPIVSTDVGDVRFLLNNVKDTAVVKTMDANLLAKCVVNVLNHQVKGINGRDKIIQLHLDGKSIACKIRDIYESLIV